MVNTVKRDRLIGSPSNLRLGQHFMVSPAVLQLIVKKVPDNSVVIEIGAGTGNLTEVLAKKTRKVIAIEIDERFKADLIKKRQRHRNIEIVIGNVLSADMEKLIKKESKSKHPVYIVSNLPYHIVEPFITKSARWGLKMILTVGKKFGFQSRITDPTNSAFSELSFITRSFFNVAQIAYVPKSAFSPPPNTDSMILEFSPKKQPLTAADFTAQKLIIEQKHGGLIKNALMEAIIILNKTKGISLTKNESRAQVAGLELPDQISQKSFAQLTNEEIRELALAVRGYFG